MLRGVMDRARAGLFMLAACATLGFPASANAQGLIEFLWGGGSEWGGGRQSVSFSSNYKPGDIVVSFGDRRLYHVTGEGRATSYPIAIPREQSRWSGVTSVSMKRENPSWTPTPTMLKENPRLPRYVPGGHPMNPLGNRAMYLGSSLYRIHGTDAPWTIGQAVSKGCIRMFNEDVMHLYPRVKVGSKVIVTWKRLNPGPAGTYASNDAPAPSYSIAPSSRRAPVRSYRPPTEATETKKRSRTRVTRVGRSSLSAPYVVRGGRRVSSE